MEKSLEFNSQICTTREQSERLLALGLKKETADCGYFYGRQEHEEYEDWETIILDTDWQSYWVVTDKEIPAWSLHRLVEIMFKGDIEGFVGYNIHANSVNIMYEYAISNIEALIKMGTFNKDYLEEEKK